MAVMAVEPIVAGLAGGEAAGAAAAGGEGAAGGGMLRSFGKRALQSSAARPHHGHPGQGAATSQAPDVGGMAAARFNNLQPGQFY